MTAALVLAMFAGAEPADVHDVLLTVGEKPAVRLRLKIELGGKSLASRDADAKQLRESLKGKPGVGALDRLIQDGSLLLAEALAAELPHPAALSNAIFKALDTNRDGRLSMDELAAADKVLLSKFDLDDDECISPLELVTDLQSVAPKRQSVGQVRVSVVPVEGKADLTQTVKLSRSATHWRGKAGDLQLDIHTRQPLAADKPAMPKSLLAADRAEAKAAFEKVAASVVTLTVVPGPIGLFQLLDTDRDAQLSVAELRAASTVLANWKPSDTGVSFVIVPGVASAPAIPLVRAFTRESGPAWFRAMDKNGDGYVSPREFLGTPEQFRKIDTNCDALISDEEATKATPTESKDR